MGEDAEFIYLHEDCHYTTHVISKPVHSTSGSFDHQNIICESGFRGSRSHRPSVRPERCGYDAPTPYTPAGFRWTYLRTYVLCKLMNRCIAYVVLCTTVDVRGSVA